MEWYVQRWGLQDGRCRTTNSTLAQRLKKKGLCIVQMQQTLNPEKMLFKNCDENFEIKSSHLPAGTFINDNIFHLHLLMILFPSFSQICIKYKPCYWPPLPMPHLSAFDPICWLHIWHVNVLQKWVSGHLDGFVLQDDAPPNQFTRWTELKKKHVTEEGN